MLKTPEDGHEARPVVRAGRGQRPGQADQAVAADLQQDAGQDHADRRRRLDVGVGQPGVERERRQLDAEADEEQDEDPRLDRRGRSSSVSVAIARQLHDVERVAREDGLPGRVASDAASPGQK